MLNLHRVLAAHAEVGALLNQLALQVDCVAAVFSLPRLPKDCI